MTLVQLLVNKVTNDKIEDIAKAVGYHNIEKGIARIKYIINEPYLGLLGKGKYDFVHSNETLVKALIEVLSISSEVYEQELYAINKIKFFIQRAQYKHIKVITKRNNDSLQGMALMALHRLMTIKNLHYLEEYDMDTQLLMVGNIIKNHHIDNEGEIKKLGDITGYEYHYEDGVAPILFNIEGKVLSLNCDFTSYVNGKPFYFQEI